ncbi:uncharacterized protein LOC127251212 [Andrographis paniculata]|uniref:uncharacterized protein LOC127251212 n=1 Tax=Andrographis paniculata TaxID=175694 RepID=UPI0021E76AC7|nr:uncharacterized protein LOC127251212 [Andrographis paniculata]
MLHQIMEEQCSPLGWSYYYQEEDIAELKHSLLYSTLELETSIVSAHEEISRKDDEIVQLKCLLSKIIEERDEFQAKCQELVMEKQVLYQQVQIQTHSSKQECPVSSNTTTSNQDDNIDSSPSDCDDNNNNITIALSGCKDTLPLPSTPAQGLSFSDIADKITLSKPLPDKGKFLQAVMEAGPLLQTLLLAGPLPQWQHPPPQLNSIDIPPVTISSPKMKILHQDSCLISPNGSFSNKRSMVSMESLDPSPNSKHQKVCSPSNI